MTAYISVSYSKRKLADKAIHAIATTLHTFNIISFVFVDAYKFDLAQEKQMMQQAITDIDNCDMLIAEVSDKAIGIGVEAGYAKGRDKPLIYIRQKEAEHSTTVSGISDFQIVYEDADDLQKQLAAAINAILDMKN